MIGTMMEKAARVRAVNEANGWHEEFRSLAVGMALLHSEVSEALEAYREHGLDGWETVKTVPGGYCSPEIAALLARYGYEFEMPDPPCDSAGRCYFMGFSAPLDVVPWTPEEKMTLAKAGVAKPEGVGSELADVLIRLLDQTDRQGVDLDAAMAAHVGPPGSLAVVAGFPQQLAWLHWAISKLYAGPDPVPWVLSFIAYALIVIARDFDIDLEWEFERKLAFNATRGHKHGGKRL